jgi:RNA polymerase sigma-70 factor (ECF subfamily)
MTEPTPPETLFRRYRDQGDPAALAAVFDQTAPRLLLLAAHVTPDAAAAEDVLQETFLAAMEAAPRWDDSRPLLPWLAGILRHKAMHLARHRRRRPADPLDDFDPPAAGATPADAIADGELFERIQEALGGMPQPYREVLLLRLVHGLEPTAIAHTLGRAPGTVRTQMQRGLELLRGALPATLATGLALLLTPGRGLAATRAAVLGTTAARAARPLPWIASLTALLAIVAGAWWLLQPPAPTAPSAGGAIASAPAGGPSAASGSTAAAAEAKQPAADRRAADDAAAAAAPTMLRGRLVAARDRVPLPGGKVEIAYGRGSFMTDDPEFRTWPEPHSELAAADGTFAIAVAAAPARRVFLSVSAPGHVGADTEWISLRNGLDVDLGDIALIAGSELRARVVDVAGAPVPGLQVSIERESGGVETGELFVMWSSFDSTSDDDGNLPPSMLPLPGTFSITTSGPLTGYRVVRPSSLVLDAAPSTVLDIVVDRAPAAESLRGRVVDARGNPVAGVPLQADASMAELGAATSAADGTFAMEIYGIEPETELAIPWQRPEFRLLEPERTYRRGQNDVEVKVAVLPRTEVTLEVVDARSGEPVTSFGVRHAIDVWSDDDPQRIPAETVYFPARAETRPGGRMQLPALAPGRYRVSVFPADPTLAPARLVPFVVGDSGTAPVRIELHPYVPLQVLVRDTDGKPVSGAEVGLVHEQGCEGQMTSLFSVEELARGVGGGQRCAALLQSRTTGDDGLVELQAPAAETRLQLRVAGPRCRSAQQKLPALPASGGRHEVVVARAARLFGRLEPAELLAAIGPSPQAIRTAAMVRPENSELAYSCPQLQVRDAAGKVVARGRVMPDATFRIDAVPAGDHQLWLEIEWHMNPGHVTREELMVAQVPGLRADEEREVVASAAAAEAVQVRGTVRVNGAVWAAGDAGLLEAKVAAGRYFTLPLDPAGAFARAVPADTYLPYVEWQEGEQSKRLWADARVTLAAGEQTLALAFERRSLSLEVHTAVGQAASGMLLRVTAVDFPELGSMTTDATDADGRVRLDPAPPGRLMIAARSGDAWVDLGSAIASPDRVHLTLPR